MKDTLQVSKGRGIANPTFKLWLLLVYSSLHPRLNQTSPAKQEVNISINADVNRGPIFRAIQQALTINTKINQANIPNPPNKIDRLMILSLSLFIDDPPSWLSEVTKPLNLEKNATIGGLGFENRSTFSLTTN